MARPLTIVCPACDDGYVEVELTPDGVDGVWDVVGGCGHADLVWVTYTYLKEAYERAAREATERQQEAYDNRYDTWRDR